MGCPSFRVQSSLIKHDGLLDRGCTRWLCRHALRLEIAPYKKGNINAPATLEYLHRPDGNCRTEWNTPRLQ
ncbi:hypothetical protein ACN38_g206 [Penicillium nordicum]|uniref:Uncharacterized protein n=2 Tax=Penicillium TaxID=5073 RepID=A0A0M8PJ89_9EURO|nr:hypothetical protein ACN38_g206 [Penicillium nordicum]